MTATNDFSADTQYTVSGGDGVQYGPASMSTLIEWARQNRITADTLIAPVGSQHWRRADSFLELAPLFHTSARQSYAAPHYSTGNSIPYNGPMNGGRTNTMAIASLICSLAGFVFCPVVLGALGVVFGFIALSQIKRSLGQESGGVMAVVGIAIGLIMVLLTVLLCLVVLVIMMSGKH